MRLFLALIYLLLSNTLNVKQVLLSFYFTKKINCKLGFFYHNLIKTFAFVKAYAVHNLECQINEFIFKEN